MDGLRLGDQGGTMDQDTGLSGVEAASPEAAAESAAASVPASASASASADEGYQDPKHLIHLLDARLRPVPVGVPGEIYLAGKQLARGYLNRPGLTSERFVADPFTPGSRMYRTGDRATWRAGGILDYIGRVDSQVKIRGFRIELGEIEAVLGAHESVAQVAVVAREGKPGSGAATQLVAYVVTAVGAQFDVAHLREHLAAQLPEYMLPAAIVSMDRLPTTPNGKLDRAALPEPVFTGSGVYRAPRSSVEDTLATLYAHVLGLDRVGIDDDFLVIGGDSIRSIQVVSRAKALGVQVSQRQIFENRTIAKLAEVATAAAERAPLTAEELDEDEAALVSVSPAEIEAWERRYPGLTDVWPLTSLQSGFLFHTMLSAADAPAGGDAYLMQMTYHLSGAVEPVRMRAAGQALLRRHANLRVAFVAGGDGNLVQIVPGQVELPWQEADLTSLPEVERDAAFDAFLARDRAAGFDPATPPLLRMSLVKLGGKRFELVITAHHALFDGWSEPILEQDLLRLYSSGGDESGLKQAGSFRDFMLWLSRQDRQASARAWARELDGVSEPTLLGTAADQGESHAAGETAGLAKSEAKPDAKPDSNAVVVDASPGVGLIEVGLSAQEAVALSRRAAELGVTLNTLVQGAWGVLLGALTGRPDVVFGATVSGRPPALADVDTMVGLFINTLPVRVRCERAENLAAVLTGLQERQVKLLDHHYYGLTDIHQATGLAVLFDTLVVFESYPTDEAATAEAYADSGLVQTGIRRFTDTNFPLVLGAYADPRLRLGLQYREDAVPSSAVQGIADCLLRILRQVLADPQVKVALVEVLTQDERDSWAARWTAPKQSSAPAQPTKATVTPTYLGDQPYRAPQTELEAQLCALLAEILELDRVGVDDDFFALGGNSLHATRIVNRIRTDLGADVSLRLIFQYSTVAKLAAEWPAPTTSSRPQLRKMTRE